MPNNSSRFFAAMDGPWTDSHKLKSRFRMLPNPISVVVLTSRHECWPACNGIIDQSSSSSLVVREGLDIYSASGAGLIDVGFIADRGHLATAKIKALIIYISLH